jgi:uncharacterized protein DUF6159
MFARFERSWNLASACMRLLLEDKSLLVFPLLSSIAVVLVIGSFAVPLLSLVGFLSSRGAEHTLSSLSYVALFVFYWLQFSVIVFFNTALVEVAMRRFDGENATTGDGLQRAWSRLLIILVYALIAATVGTVLRIIAERVGLIGRIVVSVIGFAWTVATALVVPVLAAEDVGPFDAVRRSVELIKKAWGEDIIGNAGIGLVFGVVMFVVVLSGGFVTLAAFVAHDFALVLALLVALILAVCLLALAQTALQGIYAAALYRYANGDPATVPIDTSLLQDAFRKKE